jgi:hypothetical protein
MDARDAAVCASAAAVLIAACASVVLPALAIRDVAMALFGPAFHYMKSVS